MSNYIDDLFKKFLSTAVADYLLYCVIPYMSREEWNENKREITQQILGEILYEGAK